MKHLRLTLAAAAVAAALLASPIGTAVALAATPVFSDEFNAGPLNLTSWKTVLPWGTQWNNREQMWYDPANISFANGSMRFLTEKRSTNGYPYASAVATTRNRYGYGYYEVRAKLPKGRGVWPAIWLLKDGGTAAEPAHELDIMEMLGHEPNKVYMTYHRSGGQVYQARYVLPTGDFSQAYHTFAADWQPNYIRWYVDGVLRGEYTGTIYASPQNIILNTAVGDSTSWPGAPDGTTVMPQTMDIDYVRMYPTKPADGTQPAPTPTPDPTVPTTPVNTAPAATADSYSTTPGTAISIAAPGVLGNDRDAEGNPLTASLVAQPANGTVALSANGSFIYTPAAGFTGTDTFSYRTSDGSLSSAVTPVSITVRAVDGAPVASADSYTMDQGTTLRIPAPGVLANDREPNGQPMTAFIAVWPKNGSATMQRDGSFTYTPRPDFTGTDTFTYRATDETLNSPVTPITVTVKPVVPPVVVTPVPTPDPTPTPVPTPEPTPTPAPEPTPVPTPTPTPEPTPTPVPTPEPTATPAPEPTPVNTAPVAVDDAYQTREGRPLTVTLPGVLGNDTDADGDALNASIVSRPSNGTLTLGANGTFLYTPAAGFRGSDSFTYRAFDGQSSSTARVSIAVKRAPRGRHWRAEALTLWRALSRVGIQRFFQ